MEQSNDQARNLILGHELAIDTDLGLIHITSQYPGIVEAVQAVTAEIDDDNSGPQSTDATATTESVPLEDELHITVATGMAALKRLWHTRTLIEDQLTFRVVWGQPADVEVFRPTVYWPELHTPTDNLRASLITIHRDTFSLQTALAKFDAIEVPQDPVAPGRDKFKGAQLPPIDEPVVPKSYKKAVRELPTKPGEVAPDLSYRNW